MCLWILTIDLCILWTDLCNFSITLISFLLRVPYDLFSYQLNIIIQTCFVWFGDSKFWIWIRLPDFRGIPAPINVFFQQLIFRVVAKTSQFPCLYTLQTKCVMKFQIKSDDDIYRQHLEEGEKHRRSSLALRMEETFEELNLQISIHSKSNLTTLNINSILQFYKTNPGSPPS